MKNGMDPFQMLIGGSSRCVPSIRAPPPPARGHSLPCRPGLLRDSDSIDASHGLARGAHHPAQAERPAQPDAAHQGQDRLTRAIAPRILPALCIRLSLPVGGLCIGEICGLRLRDLDLDHGLLYVRHSVGRGPAVLGSYQLANLQDTIAKLRKRPKISLENSITVDS